MSYSTYNEALEAAQAEKSSYGAGISVMCVLGNTTANPISYVDHEDYHGHVYVSDAMTNNGAFKNSYVQWLSVHSKGSAVGAACGVVFRDDNNNCDIFMGYEAPFSGDNKIYVEVNDIDHWHRGDSNLWEYMYNNLIEKAGQSSSYTRNGITIQGTIDNIASSPVATITIITAG